MRDYSNTKLVLVWFSFFGNKNRILFCKYIFWCLVRFKNRTYGLIAVIFYVFVLHSLSCNYKTDFNKSKF